MAEGKRKKITIYVPSDLHDEIGAYAAGGGKRPPASVNATYVFLLRVGLWQQQRMGIGQEPPGESSEESRQTPWAAAA